MRSVQRPASPTTSTRTLRRARTYRSSARRACRCRTPSPPAASARWSPRASPRADRPSFETPRLPLVPSPRTVVAPRPPTRRPIPRARAPPRSPRSPRAATRFAVSPSPSSPRAPRLRSPTSRSRMGSRTPPPSSPRHPQAVPPRALQGHQLERCGVRRVRAQEHGEAPSHLRAARGLRAQLPRPPRRSAPRRPLWWRVSAPRMSGRTCPSPSERQHPQTHLPPDQRRHRVRRRERGGTPLRPTRRETRLRHRSRLPRGATRRRQRRQVVLHLRLRIRASRESS